MGEKWSHLTAAHGQPSAVTENISNAFSPGPFLRLTDGEVHKETKELAPRQSAAKDCSLQQHRRFRPYLQASSSGFCNSLEKRRGFACFSCNSQLTGRWLKIFVAQDSPHGLEGVTSSSSARPSLIRCEVVFFVCISDSSHAADAFVLPSTSCILQEADVTKSGWIAALLCSESAAGSHRARAMASPGTCKGATTPLTAGSLASFKTFHANRNETIQPVLLLQAAVPPLTAHP